MSTPTEVYSLDTYQAESIDTAIYPEAGAATPAAILYAALGLTNEAGELAGVTKKMLRDATAQEKVRGLVFKEGGDVLYYAARVLAELDVPLGWACDDVETFAEFQDIAEEEASYPDATGRSATAVVYCTLKLSGAAGKVADAAAATLDSSLTREALVAEVGTQMRAVMYWLARTADEVALSLADIANGNRAKLLDRQARGVIGGSGDDR